MREVFCKARIQEVPKLSGLNSDTNYARKYAALEQRITTVWEKNQDMGPQGPYEDDVEGGFQSLNICSGKMNDSVAKLCIGAQMNPTEINEGKEKVLLTHQQQCRSSVDHSRRDIGIFQIYASNGDFNEQRDEDLPSRGIDTRYSTQYQCDASDMNMSKLLWQRSKYRSSPTSKDQKHNFYDSNKNKDRYYTGEMANETLGDYGLGLSDSATHSQIAKIYRVCSDSYMDNSINSAQCNNYLATREREIHDMEHECNSDNVCNVIGNRNINNKCENGSCTKLKRKFGINQIQNPWNVKDQAYRTDEEKGPYSDFRIQPIEMEVNIIKSTEADHLVSRDTQTLESSHESQLQFNSAFISISDAHKNYANNGQKSDAINNQTLPKFKPERRNVRHHEVDYEEAANWSERAVNCGATQSWDYYLEQNCYVVDNSNELDTYQYDNTLKFATNTAVQPFLIEKNSQNIADTMDSQGNELNNNTHRCIPQLTDGVTDYSTSSYNPVANSEVNSYVTPPPSFEQPQDSYLVRLNAADSYEHIVKDPPINPYLSAQQRLIDDLTNAPKIPRRGRPPSKIGLQSKISPIEVQPRSSVLSFSPVREKQQVIRRLSEPSYQYSSNFTIDPVIAKVSMAVQAAVPVGPPNLPSGFKCPFSGCEKVIKYRWGLKAHIWTHCGTRTHICSACGTGFMRKNDLMRHIRRHTNEKPHVCELCGKTFSRSDALKKHRYMDASLHSSARVKS